MRTSLKLCFANISEDIFLNYTTYSPTILITRFALYINPYQKKKVAKSVINSNSACE